MSRTNIQKMQHFKINCCILLNFYTYILTKNRAVHNAPLCPKYYENKKIKLTILEIYFCIIVAAFEGGHIIHGAANAMYLPKVIKYNSKDETAAKRYAYIADFLGLGGDTTEAKIDNLIAMLRKMNDELNIPQCIKNYGEGGLPAEQGIVPEDEFLAKLPEVAANAISDACTGSNPRQPSQEEMEKLLKCCYYDKDSVFLSVNL